MFVKKVSDKRKLHKRLAEGGKLRIYRVMRQSGRCVICATAIVDPHNRRVHLKENPTLKERMNDPEQTNGTPLDLQWWLQDETGKLIGPCGAACGPLAVMNAWLKERRDEIRQQLLAAGVPAAEVEERLEQIAHQEWLNMLRIYRKAEREAKQLGINITSMTVDEIVEAIKIHKERKAFEREVDYAQSLGIPVARLAGGVVEIDGVRCSSSRGVMDTINKWEDDKAQAAKQAAAQKAQGNRAKYPDHVEFIEWALSTTGPNNPNGPLSYRDDRILGDGMIYIDMGSPYPGTLRKVEELAQRARTWTVPWQGKLGQQVVVQNQPAGGGANLPTCPICGSQLQRKQGFSNRRGRYGGKRYDFYGCVRYPQCRGSVKVQEYNRQLQALNPGQVTQQPPPPPVSVPVQAPKAVAAAQAQQQAAPPPPTPAPVSKPKRKRTGYWS